MASPKATASIDAFWSNREVPQAFMQLIEELDLSVVSNLERHPGIGRRFFVRSFQSLEVRERVSTLQQRLGNIDVREYLSG